MKLLERVPEKAAVLLSLFGAIALNNGETITSNGYGYLLIIVLSFIVAVIQCIKRLSIPGNKILKYQVLFLAFCYLSCQWAYSYSAASAGSKSVLLTTIIIFTFAVLLNDEEMTVFFCRAIVLAQFLSLLYFAKKYGAMFIFNLRSDETIARPGELNANSVGMTLVFSSFLSFISSRIGKKGIYPAAAIAYAALSLCTASKKAVLLLGILYLGYYILSSKNPLAVLRKLIIAAILVYAAYYAIMNINVLYNLIGKRFEEVFALISGDRVDKYSSTGLRMEMLKTGQRLIKQKPWFGWGIANAAKFNYGTYMHNNFYELLTGIGIIGTVIYYLRYISLVKGFWVNFNNKNPLSVAAPLLAFSVISMDYAFVSYNVRFIQVILVSAAAILNLLNYKRSETK